MARPAGTTGQAKVLDEKELRQVIRVTEVGNFGKRNVALLILSNFLGLRAKEMAALSISDVFDGQNIKKTLRLVAAYTKGSKHRDLPLENRVVTKALADYIAERKSEDGFRFHMDAPLFRSQRMTRFTANSLVQVMGRIYTAAGFPDATSHSGRRSLITKLAYDGVDVNSIRQIAGHSRITTTQRYIEDSPIVIANILKNI
jgi:integrase/recombinase XerD